MNPFNTEAFVNFLGWFVVVWAITGIYMFILWSIEEIKVEGRLTLLNVLIFFVASCLPGAGIAVFLGHLRLYFKEAFRLAGNFVIFETKQHRATRIATEQREAAKRMERM